MYDLHLCGLLIVIICMAVKIDIRKEILFGSSDPNISRVLSKKEKDSELRKKIFILPKIVSASSSHG